MPEKQKQVDQVSYVWSMKLGFYTEKDVTEIPKIIKGGPKTTAVQ